MKKNLLFITLVFFILSAGAQTTDYLQKKDFQSEKTKIYSNLNSAKKAALEVKKLITEQNVKIDSLNKVIAVFTANNAHMTDMTNQMSQKVTTMEEKVNVTNGKLTTNLLIALVITVVAFIILLVILLVLWRKVVAGNQSIHEEFGLLNEKMQKEIQAIHGELKDSLGLINSKYSTLDHKISTGMNEITTKNEMLNQQLIQNNVSLQEQLKKTCEDNETRVRAIKTEFDAKREELLSHVDKNILTLSTELKKIKQS